MTNAIVSSADSVANLISIPHDVLNEIFLFSLSTTLNGRQICRLTRDLIDKTPMKNLWDQLKKLLPQDCLAFKEMMAEVEIRNTTFTSFHLFKKLKIQIHRQYGLPTIGFLPIFCSHFTKIQQTLDQNLLNFWPCILPYITRLQNPLQTAQEIRNFLNNPDNAPLLDSINSIFVMNEDINISALPFEVNKLTSLERIKYTSPHPLALPYISSLRFLKHISTNGNRILKSDPSTRTKDRKLILAPIFFSSYFHFKGKACSLFKEKCGRLELKFELNMKGESDSIELYCEQLSYPCQTAFGKFYQMLSNLRISDINHQHFLCKLPNEIRNLIFWKTWNSSGSPQGDSQWGEHHVFDDATLFYKQVKATLNHVVKAKLKKLDSEKRNAVYGMIYELAGCPKTEDDKWGKTMPLKTYRA